MSADAQSVPPLTLSRLIRGFSCMFWGLPLTLLLLFDVVEFRGWLRVRCPVFVLGILLVFYGVMLLNRAPSLTRRWPRWIGQARVVLLMLVYLAPFAYWWRTMPHVRYYEVNMAVLFAVGLWGFFLANQLAAEVGLALGDRALYIESRLCAWVSVVSFLSPGVVFLGRSLLSAAFTRGNGVLPLSLVAYLLPRWMVVLVLLPFTLTMMTVWRAKGLCWRALDFPAPDRASGV